MKTFTVRFNKQKAQVEMFTVNDECLIRIEGESVELSDTYHTIHELYQHRMALNIALFNCWSSGYDNRIGEVNVVKSKLHHDGTMFDGGYFIVMATTKEGQVSYHYKLEHWDKFLIREVERAPEWDGEGSAVVMQRLMKL